MAHVPTFAADGRRLRKHSVDAIERLESLKLVVVQRNRRGTIVSAHYYGQTRTPLQARLKQGTGYCFLELVSEQGGRIWSHKALPVKAVDAQLEHLASAEVLDSHVRALFQSVPLSIATDHPAPARKLAPVVSIEFGRSAKPATEAPAVLKQAA